LAAHPQVRDMPIRVFFLKKNMRLPFGLSVPLPAWNAGFLDSFLIFIAAKQPADQINSINGFVGGNRKTL
jgi:hypothetical protein